MADWAAKRFWEKTTVAAEGEGFTVHLDGRPVRTPAKAPFVVPTRALAEAAAAEWDAQEGEIDPRTMPVTRGANVAIDRVVLAMDEVVDMLADYGDADLLCYRATYPDALTERQNEQWNPLLDWAAETFDARLEARSGVMHIAQSPTALAKLKAEAQKLDAFELSAFHDLVTLSGSLVVALAATSELYPIESLWDISRLDENFQAEQWGEDEEAEKEAAIKRDSFLRAFAFYKAAQK